MSRVNLDRKSIQSDLTEQCGQCNIRQVSKLFYTFAQVKGQSLKGQGHIGSMTASCAISKFNQDRRQ